MPEPSIMDMLQQEEDEQAVPSAAGTPAGSESQGMEQEGSEYGEDGGMQYGDGQEQYEDYEQDDDDDVFAELEEELGADDDDEDDGEDDQEVPGAPAPYDGGDDAHQLPEAHSYEATPAATPATTPGTWLNETPAAAVATGYEGAYDSNVIGEDDIDDDDLAGEDYSAPGSMPGQSSLPDEMLQAQGTGRAAKQSAANADAADIAALERKRKQLESAVMQQLDSVQQERFEMYKRSKIKGGPMKKVVDAVAGGRTIHPNVVTAMCGVTKLYVGEIVELARAIATRGGHHGALLPTHVYQAYHALEEVQPSPTKKARLFR